MPIKRITPMSQIENHLHQEIELKTKSIIKILRFIGESCVNQAKENPGYLDRSGNLRSSIGYVVVNNGSIVSGGEFERVVDGDDGVRSGEAFIQKLVSENSKGIVLIVVAGMNYAAHVETNKNVISSSELLAERLVPQMLRQLGLKIS